MYGPAVDQRHDLTLYRIIELTAELEGALIVDVEYYFGYGDAVYMLSPWLQVGYGSTQTTMEEESYTAIMNAVWTAVA